MFSDLFSEIVDWTHEIRVMLELVEHILEIVQIQTELH